MVTYAIPPGPIPVPSSSVVNDVSGPTQNTLPLIIGLVVGLVGLLIISVLMVIIVVGLVVIVRQRKSSTFTEQPFYDDVIPQPLSTQSDGIELKENEAYGNVLSDTSQTWVSTLQPNIAYGVVQTH